MHALIMAAVLCTTWEPPALASPDERIAFADLTAPCQSFIKRHAATTFEMPDGSVWDGYYYFELRKLLDIHLSRQPIKKSVPAGIFRENKIVGYKWKFTESQVVKAWGLEIPEQAAHATRPRIVADYSRAQDASRTNTWPVLWHSPDLGKPPVYFDDGTFLGTTGPDRGEEIKITQQYEDGTVDIEGWAPVYDSTDGRDDVAFRGRALLDKRIRPKDGKLSGKFFVHHPPADVDTAAELFVTRMDDHRVTSDKLLELVQDCRIALYEFDYSRTTDGRYIWRREPFKPQIRKRATTPAPAAPGTDRATTPNEAPPAPGLDRLLLKDGRLFVGKVIGQDDKMVKIRTLIGTMEAELSFARADVQNVHIEPQGAEAPKSDE